MAVCIKCEERISDSDKFCPHCGHKRETCSCGAFIDHKPRYCAECGKMTHYGIEYYQEILNERKLGLKERKKGIKESEEEKRNLEERKSLWEGRKTAEENRKKEVAKLAKKLGIETGLTFAELKNNFAVKKGYIELILPIECLTIKRIKFLSWPYCFYEAKNLGNWRLPTKEELEIIYKIRCFCEIKELSAKGWVWSDSGGSQAWCLNFDDGNFDKFEKTQSVTAGVCLVTDGFEKYESKDQVYYVR